MFYNYYSYIHVIRGSCDVSMRIRMSRRLSFVIVLCSHSMEQNMLTFKFYARVVPHPSAYCCLECCPYYFVLLGLLAETSFQLSVLTWSEDQKVDSKYKNFNPTSPSVELILGDCLWAQGRHHNFSFYIFFRCMFFLFRSKCFKSGLIY